jgi:hypothetical protein
MLYPETATFKSARPTEAATIHAIQKDTVTLLPL